MESIAAASGVIPPRKQEQGDDLAPPQMTESKTTQIASEDIAKLAYALWQQRGCPEGTSHQDWTEAEQQVREAKAATAR